MVYFQTKKELLENIQPFEKYDPISEDMLDRQSDSVKIDQLILKMSKNLNLCLKIINYIF